MYAPIRESGNFGLAGGLRRILKGVFLCLVVVRMTKRLPIALTLIFSGTLFIAGCVKLALDFSPSLIPNFVEALYEECDPDLAKHSFPADLKLMEGLLKNAPNNKRLLTALCMGFTGYAMLFVEDEAPERASHLYIRGRAYGLKALGLEALIGEEGGLKDFRRRLLALGKGDIEALFWTSAAWNAWINLNLDKPAALTQLRSAQVCLERVLDVRPGYLYGVPYIMMGSILAAKPRLLGGDEAKARECFEKAMDLSQRKFFLAHYYFAKYYAVRVQDKELFLALIREIERAPYNELKRACLINAVMKQKTQHLLQMIDDLFL
jgi:hypothetical protein